MPFPGSMPPGMMGPPGMIPSPGMMGEDTSSKLMALSRGGRRVSGDLVRRIIDDLETLREIDPKLAVNASMAIHILREGPDRLEEFQRSEHE